MNKNDIMDAWLTVEHLSEGNLDKDSSSFEINKIPKISTKEEINNHTKYNWKEYFSEVLEKYYIKNKEKNEKKDLSNMGIIIYFGVFKTSELLESLREVYGTEETYEDIDTSSEKFTLSLSFDKDLKFIPEDLFLTMVGYVKNNNRFPDNLVKLEEEEREKLKEKFEERDFNEVFNELTEKYLINEDNFKFKIFDNIKSDFNSLHSFFVDDLISAKSIHTDNLDRYLFGFTGNRKNLDGNLKSDKFNPMELENILQPKNYPMGRFPSNPKYALSFMQQVAVNLYLNDSNNILSVNGPPGTGKTTLLKDIFADLIVRQAYEMMDYLEVALSGTENYYDKALIAEIPSQISKYNIIVASSNNGAVQNIVNDLPLIKNIDDSFLEKIIEVDYFKNLSNQKIKIDYIEDKETEKKFRQKTHIELDEKNWGLFSMEGGASTNVSNILNYIESILEELKGNEKPSIKIIEEFKDLYKIIKNKKDEMQKVYLKYKEFSFMKNKLNEIEEELNSRPQRKLALENSIKNIEKEIELLKEKIENFQNIIFKKNEELKLIENDIVTSKRNLDVILAQKTQKTFLEILIGFFKKRGDSEYTFRLNNENNKLNNLENKAKEIKTLIDKSKSEFEENKSKIETSMNKKIKMRENFENYFSNKTLEKYTLEEDIRKIEDLLIKKNILNFNQSYEKLQLSNPWFDDEFRKMQSNLFILALGVRKYFLALNNAHLKAALNILRYREKNIQKDNGKKLIKIAWEWINFTIPVVSSTFASFGRMFKYFDANSLGALFIDEAGQATPQASVGAIFRSKKVMVVGDPSQIKPVLILDSNIMIAISKNYKISETLFSNDTSTQSLVDNASQYGFYKNEDEWIGIPLWVHRRSNYPMFNISNKISYNDLMVQGKNSEEAYGKAEWYHVEGNAENKYVANQGNFLKELLEEKIKENLENKDNIFIITPFKNIATRIIEELKSINFVKFENNKATNIGTVHTFQGKEAKIVYFVLGADEKSKGAAKWAVEEPNMLNVAATRAKEEFYIIGDQKLYLDLGSKIIKDTVQIINSYNENKEI